MEEEREGDPRVPVISCLFFLFVMMGGALLVVYVFVPKLSKPWYPKAALILIGSPWIFWFFTFTYACLKGRCGGSGSRVATARPSRRATRKGGAAAAAAANSAAAPPNKESPQPIDSGSGQGQEQNGHVEVQGEGRGDSSIASRESEKPLNSS